MTALISRNNCDVLTFELAGIRNLPFGFVDLLAVLTRCPQLTVRLFNVTGQACATLDKNQLTDLLEIQDVEIEPPPQRDQEFRHFTVSLVDGTQVICMKTKRLLDSRHSSARGRPDASGETPTGSQQRRQSLGSDALGQLRPCGTRLIQQPSRTDRRPGYLHQSNGTGAGLFLVHENRSRAADCARRTSRDRRVEAMTKSLLRT